MSETSESTAEQAAAFQKIWLESISKMLNTAFAFGTESPPPELLREIRTGVFAALAKSWEEFMRSPQFLESMKQWMESAVAFRKMSNDFMATARNEMQATSRDDIDTIMLAVRHMEKRLLDRIEEVAAQLQQLKSANGGRTARPDRGTTAPRRASKNGRKSSRRTRKTPVS
jgi:uncharacterized protein (DUF2267 family)